MIRIAVIGYGYWGPNLARCIAESGSCRLAGVADASPAARARAAQRYPGITTYADVAEVLADPNVDAVAIATPVRTHYEIALAAIHAGRHVLVEKPMTETSAQAQRLIEAAERRGRVLMVDHTFVYAGAVQMMRELVAREDLGQVLYYDSTRINLGLFQSDVNVIWDLAVHDLAILKHVLDCPVAAVSANAIGHVSGAPESMAHLTLYLAGGAVAHLNVNWLAPVKVRKVMLGGTRKMIVWDDLELSEKIKVYDRGVNVAGHQQDIHDLRVSYRVGDMWAPRISTAEPLLTEIQHFAACIEENKTPLTDGRLGLEVVELLETASRSMALRGQPIELTPLRRAS